jgi:hypothetical protein
MSFRHGSQMTEIQATPAAAPAIRTSVGVGMAVALALACGIALTWGRAGEVWATGAFFDTDDALRMAQLRDLLAGQSWFDMNVARMDAPAGVFMHWSRTVDIPLALLLKFFGLFASPATAEALTRLAFPLLLLAALYVAVARLAALFGGLGAQVAAVALAFTTGSVFTQFVPGRIDHHAPQIVLLVLMTGATLAAFEPSRAKMAAAGALAALSLSISIENLPFIAVLAAAQPIAWIFRGYTQAAAMRFYALGLVAGLIGCFGATIGPQRWFVVACDAFSIAHATAGLAGAAVLLTLALLSPRLRSLPARLLAACALAPLPLLALKLAAPTCLGDPFVGLDPLVRSIWLDHVAEVQTLMGLAQSQSSTALTIGGPLALSILATLAYALVSRGLLRARLLALTGVIAIGLAMTFWGVRVYSSVAPLAAVGGAVVAAALARRLMPESALAPVLVACLCLPFSPFAFALVLPSDPPGPESASMSCLRPNAMVPLDALPAGLVFAPIDLGSHLLVHTHHSVLGAPYHRDNHGNRLVLDGLLAAPADAEKILRESGAAYLVMCPALKQAQIIAERAPHGLAAQIIAGKTPDWLEPIDTKTAPNVAFRIRSAK